MEWKTTRNPIDLLVELAAPTLLSSAIGWAAWSLMSPLAAAAGAVAAWAISFVIIRRVGGSQDLGLTGFELAPIDDTNDHTAELLLDDPLIEPLVDSRVVRLFADTDPTPGELVARIADFLGDSGRPEPVTGEGRQPSSDAGEALHAALANIRASLR